jgi:hypothetical protein
LELDPPPDDDVVCAEVVVADDVLAAVVDADVVDAEVVEADELEADDDAGGAAADDDFLELLPQPAINTTAAATGTSAPSARLGARCPTTPIRSPPQVTNLCVSQTSDLPVGANNTRHAVAGHRRPVAAPGEWRSA